MKKVIIIIFIVLVFGLIVSNKNSTYNKKYIDYDKNTFIEYPYFNDSNIDDYLSSYLNDLGGEYDYLFIDYDYTDNSDLTMYIYKEYNNIVKSFSKSFFVSSNNSSIIYDFINERIINEDKLIALTFDDGPNYNTIKVLNILEKYGVKATFFVLGSSISGNEKIIKRMDSLGMEIGNHMYSHSIATRLDDKKLKEEISQTDKLVYDITGHYPTLVRPSYGIYNKKFQRVIDRPIILWNIDTLDWKYHDSKRIANKVFNDINRGNIVLMHDIYSATANSLEIIIPKLLDEGFEFVTVSELLSYED